MAITDLVPWKRGESEVPVKREEEYPLQTLQRNMNRLFDEFFEGTGFRPFGTLSKRWEAFSPQVDVTETDDEIKVTAELPGMSEKDVDVSLSHNVLTISGEKRAEEEREEENYFYAERSYGSFRRSFPLPTKVNVDKVEATFKDGVLRISLPKTAASEARKKISVQT